MKSKFTIYQLPAGGLLIDAGKESLLMGGGVPVEQLRQSLKNYKEKLIGILVPNEHVHRLRGLYELAVQWELPLIGHWRVLWDTLLPNALHLPSQILTDFNRNELQCGGFRLTAFPVRYDSIHPCGWMISAAGETIGVVQDGRLTGDSISVLKKCDALALNNCRKLDENDTSIQAKRNRSVYPTEEEQQTLLRNAGVASALLSLKPLNSIQE